jgi:DNA-binding transcriptional LysR family regulator
MTEPDWSLYRAFLAVLREGSLSKASRSLGLTQPSVGRQIAALEHALGTALFARGPQGLTPTEAAKALEPHAVSMESAAAALIRAAGDGLDSPRGAIRISASQIVAGEVLPPMLAGISSLAPQLSFEIEATNQNTDLLRRDADLAVRMQRPTQSALVARRIGRVDIGLYAHRRWIEHQGEPKDLPSLIRLGFIGFDRIAWRPATPVLLDRTMFRFRTDNDLVALAMLRAGLAVGGIQIPLAARDPELIRVLPEVSTPLEMWLVMHEDLKSVRRVRLVFDELAEGLSNYVHSVA